MTTSPDKAPKPRPRDAAATRKAILASARAAFSDKGYDGVGLREIAAGAGVTAMMVNRYFGSKEELFIEALRQTMTGESVIAGGIMDTSAPARALAEALIGMTRPGQVPLDGFRMAFHSASSPVATTVGKQMIEDNALKTVSGALHGDHAGQRAAMILAMISGFQGMRQMIGLSALADADEGALVGLLTGVFEGLINPPDIARD
ncbi:TetR/AcrR family transcriptional regulator [Thermomonas sp. HDW16]|uniref:TetR/AcrR family transcriptional regulator n=1 Tax=Thermomonas sp. HDW16 TaxID=2714945 RepID=UPI00140ACC09|nr:TetR/AcrR family transcriptional regulator [Thermomonas sp. HDW16]QIL20615.1 TetR/AcrR family transcriptional regulator [Thermomonas sp. HDW16]